MRLGTEKVRNGGRLMKVKQMLLEREAAEVG